MRILPLVCLLVSLSATAASALPVARLRGVRPVVELQKGGRGWKLVGNRGALVFGDTLRTGARGGAELLFNNGTQITMRARSQLQILAPESEGKPLVIRVFGALSEIFVRAKGPTEIRTAAGTAAVRGTQYDVRIGAENQTTVTVSQGRVAFFNPQGEVLVAANQQSSATVGTAPTPPVAVDVSGLLSWTLDAASLPLELDNRFSNPQNAGQRLFNAGREGDAARFFEQAPPTAANGLSLGQIRLSAGDLRGASAAFNGVLALDAASTEAKIGLALVALSSGDLAAARANLAGTETTARGALVAGLISLRAGDANAAQTELRAASARGASYEAQSLLSIALLQTGEAKSALENAQNAVKLAPDSALSRAALSLALFFGGDANRARIEARRALEIDPFSPLALLAYGRAEAARGNLDEARQALQQAAALRPDLPLVQRDLGAIEIALDHLPKAEAAFRSVLATSPNDGPALAGLGNVLGKTGRASEARAAFEAAVAASPRDASVRAQFAGFLIEQGDLEAARAQAETFLAANAPVQHGNAQHGNTQNGNTQNGNTQNGNTQNGNAPGNGQNGQGQGGTANGGTAQGGAGGNGAGGNGTAGNGAAGNGAGGNGAGGNGALLNAGGAEVGAIFIRLSEEALYRQNLAQAFEFGRRAVRLLPASAPAHYQFGRVLLEQERTVQAQAQFRLATALDPGFSRARYALGLTQELAASGRDITRALGQTSAAFEGGPSQGLSLRNLQSAGARERIQAAIADPTVVRTATRSYGDTEIAGDIGQRGVLEGQVSSLKESADRRGVLGLNASHLERGGVRDNADFSSDRAGFTFGRKAKGNPSGVFALGQFEKREFGGDTGVVANPNAGRESVKNPQLLLGMNLQRGVRSRTHLLLSAEKPEITTGSPVLTLSQNIRSLHGEARHERRLGDANLLQLGGSIGFRGASGNDFLNFPDQTIAGQRQLGIRSQVFYVRNEFRATPRLTLTGELKALRIAADTTSSNLFDPPLPGSPALSRSRSEQKGFSGLPTVLASYQLSPSTNVRARFRRLLGGIEDFELLSPSDVFLFSNPEVPFLPYAQRGRSYELELNHSFADASFLEVGAFQQSEIGGNSAVGENFNSLRFRGLRARYEGIASPRLTYFLSGDYNAARGIVDNFGAAPLMSEILAEVPRVRFETGAQYLSNRGFFVQPSVGYFGSVSRVNEFFEPRRRRGGFALANLRIGKRSGLRSVFYLEARNLTGRAFASPSTGNVTGDVGLGRQFVAGFSRRF